MRHLSFLFLSANLSTPPPQPTLHQMTHFPAICEIRHEGEAGIYPCHFDDARDPSNWSHWKVTIDTTEATLLQPTAASWFRGEMTSSGTIYNWSDIYGTIEITPMDPMVRQWYAYSWATSRQQGKRVGETRPQTFGVYQIGNQLVFDVQDLVPDEDGWGNPSPDWIARHQNDVQKYGTPSHYTVSGVTQ